ncbi:hypothetical protein F5Y05DRAFT_50583 [Hypoxylon sp. FL0543]|nr:hypothetical protein F5Y05DRAFT_50583 [Hypoxylon sp. FL0543]
MHLLYSIFVNGCLGIIIIIIILQALVFIESKNIHRKAKLSYVEARQNIQRHRAIADFSVLGKLDLVGRLASRARPNRRLIEVFDLLNSFTTDSPTIYNQSVGKARHAIHAMDVDENRWIDFFNVAENVMDSLGVIERSISLAMLVRHLVFSAMLRPFFDVDPTKLSVGDVLEATEMINELWVESKKPSRRDLRQSQERLETSLRRILPNYFPCRREDHPLNTIIPAYETMWRVVLLTYVSAAFRPADLEEREFCEVVEAFPQCLDPEDDGELFEVALNFAKEGLRLYPPTKRIRRAVPGDTSSSPDDPDIVAADIEKCHRDTRIWGHNAERFCPYRFNYLTDAMKEAYMPFGAGKHQCPTASKFGYRAILIMVVVLARRLGTRDSGSTMQFNDARLDEDLGELLPSGRMDMESWELEVGDFA